jgi:ketol-acid reductoisomerase
MKQILEDVQNGTYAKHWIAENDKGRPWFNKTREAERSAQIEQVGARLRALMPFLKPVATEETVGSAR